MGVLLLWLMCCRDPWGRGCRVAGVCVVLESCQGSPARSNPTSRRVFDSASPSSNNLVSKQTVPLHIAFSPTMANQTKYVRYTQAIASAEPSNQPKAGPRNSLL